MKLIKKNKKPEKIVVDTIHWNRMTGELETVALPVQVIDNSFVDGRNLVVRTVDKLAYEYDRTTFDNICKHFGLNDEEKEKLKALIFLNSGYINSKLLREHSVYERRYGFGEVGNHYNELTERLFKAKQAVPPPKGRKLYRLASCKKPPKLVDKSDIKDIAFLLLLTVVSIGVLALFLPLLPKDNKGIDIYLRDSDGNYVLDDSGRAITKQDACYKNTKTYMAAGLREKKDGYCDIEGKWVETE